MTQLPTKWRTSKRAKPLGHAVDAWWYGEKDGLFVVIQNKPAPHPIVCAKVPKSMVLRWADDIRKKSGDPR